MGEIFIVPTSCEVRQLPESSDQGTDSQQRPGSQIHTMNIDSFLPCRHCFTLGEMPTAVSMVEFDSSLTAATRVTDSQHEEEFLLAPLILLHFGAVLSAVFLDDCQ